jgi:HD-GYP domain-containing protein (c-di-GMP phosphodiesterase class II)
VALPHTQNAKGGRESDLPAIYLHNFTSLQFPELLPSGRRMESRTSNSLKDIYPFSILVITPDSLEPGKDYDFLFQHVGVMLWDPAQAPDTTAPGWVDIRLSKAPEPAEIALACNHMQRLLELKEQCLILHNTNAITETRNRQLNQIGVALMSEKNLGNLLNLILDKAMELTGSDAGCLYLVESKPNAGSGLGTAGVTDDYWADKQIRFKLTRNASVAFNFSEMIINPSKSSIIGYTMLEGKPLNIPDVYAIDPAAEFRHNAGFDKTSGYRTRSMLTLPMKDHRNQVVGAIQLINKCRNRTRPITSLEAADEQVATFRSEDVNLSLSLASQASVALLNAQYELDIQALFEGFINASVTAIESRDPTTSGHSNRVADYCVKLADCVGRQETGKFREARMTESQVREMRYAALLHDFGKIGVREHILTKAKKLFPEEIERIGLRAEFIKRTINWETAQAKVELLRSGKVADINAALRELEDREACNLKSIDVFYEAIGKANEPARLDQGTLDILKNLGTRTYKGTKGSDEGYLKPDELSRLLIPQGTLSEEERHEINSHVSHTYKFLSQIPWTQDLRQVALIAYSHHEKLDGSGYPRKLVGDAIPLPAQIMTVCDIFDALAATDRPYKKAMPAEKALDILSLEVKGGKIDPELFRIFVEGQAYLIQT